ncbi:MAG: glycine cleavage system aminomethyltransferase GcvT [Haloarculaceae archaeon]
MTLRQSPLRDAHEAAGADFTDFGGWEMPVDFDSIRTEHAAVRETAGKFDVSHMGQVVVGGPDAARLTGRLTTNDVRELAPGEAQYAAVTDEEGVMLDDTVVYRLPRARDGEYLFVPNAGHDAELADRWVSHRDRWDLDATVENRTEAYAMVAVQGPDARDLVDREAEADLGALARFEATATRVAGADALVARTGYTGEDGVEVICDVEDAGAVWSAADCRPCGLGARDTLRIEAGFLLSGQDFHPEAEPRTPYEAGIGFAVDLETEFVGRDALAAVAEDGPAESLLGLTLDERGVPRHGYRAESPDGEEIGHVTSGTMSPTLGEPVGLAYLPRAYDDPGREVRVVVRDEPKKAHVTATPFLP